MSADDEEAPPSEAFAARLAAFREAHAAARPGPGVPEVPDDAIVDIDDFIGRPPTPALVRDTLTRRGIAQLVAPSGAGKTFVALHLMWHVTQERASTWFGHDVLDHGPVVYYPTEGLDTIGPRASALHEAFGPRDHAIVVVERSDLLPLVGGGPEGREALSSALLRKLDGHPPVMFVVDTQMGAISSAGVDENSNTEMHSVINAVSAMCGPDGLDCLLLLVHHTGKDAARGGRGASSQFGYMDCVIELDNHGKTLGTGPYFVRPTKFKPGVPWGDDKQEYRMVELSEGRTYIEHVVGGAGTATPQEVPAPEGLKGRYPTTPLKAMHRTIDRQILDAIGDGAGTRSEIMDATGHTQSMVDNRLQQVLIFGGYVIKVSHTTYGLGDKSYPDEPKS